MDQAGIVRVLTALGSSRIAAHPNARGELQARCPFTTSHRNGDRIPSFAVHVAPGGESRWNCKGCGKSGTNITILIEAFIKHTRVTGDRLRELRNLRGFAQTADFPAFEDLEIPAYSGKKGRPSKTTTGATDVVPLWQPPVVEPEEFLDESDLDAFEDFPSEVRQYLIRNRRLLPETIDRWELRWYPTTKRIAIPIRNSDGLLVGITGRSFGADGKRKFLHSTGFRGSRYLYGEHGLDPGGVGVVVEGFFDVMVLRQSGYRAVGLFGTSLSWEQLAKITKLFKYVIVLMDGDQAGSTAAAKVSRLLTGRVPHHIVELPEKTDPDQLSREQMLSLLGEPDPKTD